MNEDIAKVLNRVEPLFEAARMMDSRGFDIMETYATIILESVARVCNGSAKNIESEVDQANQFCDGMKETLINAEKESNWTNPHYAVEFHKLLDRA